MAQMDWAGMNGMARRAGGRRRHRHRQVCTCRPRTLHPHAPPPAPCAWSWATGNLPRPPRQPDYKTTPLLDYQACLAVTRIRQHRAKPT